jgi:hypothetical protein
VLVFRFAMATASPAPSLVKAMLRMWQLRSRTRPLQPLRDILVS